jgi:hypothetical protein
MTPPTVLACDCRTPRRPHVRRPACPDLPAPPSSGPSAPSPAPDASSRRSWRWRRPAVFCRSPRAPVMRCGSWTPCLTSVCAISCGRCRRARAGGPRRLDGGRPAVRPGSRRSSRRTPPRAPRHRQAAHRGARARRPGARLSALGGVQRAHLDAHTRSSEAVHRHGHALTREALRGRHLRHRSPPSV